MFAHFRPLRLVALALCVSIGPQAFAELTKEHRSEIAEVTKSLTPVAGHVRKKEFDEADKLIKAAEEKITAIATEAALSLIHI